MIWVLAIFGAGYWLWHKSLTPAPGLTAANSQPVTPSPAPQFTGGPVQQNNPGVLVAGATPQLEPSAVALMTTTVEQKPATVIVPDIGTYQFYSPTPVTDGSLPPKFLGGPIYAPSPVGLVPVAVNERITSVSPAAEPMVPLRPEVASSALLELGGSLAGAIL